MSDSLERLKAILAEVTDLSRAAALLEWDQETYMPPGGVAARSDQLSTLLRLSHVRLNAGEAAPLPAKRGNKTSEKQFDSSEASLVRVPRRDYEQERKLPPDLVAEVARAGLGGRAARGGGRRAG